MCTYVQKSRSWGWRLTDRPGKLPCMTTSPDPGSGAAGAEGPGVPGDAEAPAGESTRAASRRRVFRGRRRANVDAAGDGKRSRRTVITHTEAEFVRVAAMAAAMGVSRPRLYERALEAGDALAAARMADIAVQVESARRGVAGGLSNLNQIARWANTEESFTPEMMEQLHQIARDLKAQYDVFNEVLSGLPGRGDL